VALDDGRSRAAVNPRQIAVAVLSLSSFLAVATIGFRLIEGWSWFDAFYMVLISVTTVGYGEVHPLSNAGRVFAMATIVFGVGVGSYVLLTVTRNFFEGVVEGSIQRAVARRRVKSQLPRLQNHTIVCGFGRLGREICRELRLAGNTVVVIDNTEQRVEMAEAQGYLFVQGDASAEAVLLEAGVLRARSLAVATPTDALNTYIVLTARDVAPDVHILARATDDQAARRMKKAGASEAVSPYHVGGLRMAALLLRPAVVDFMDVASAGEFPDIFIEQLLLGPGSRLAGRSLREAEYQAKYKVIVLAAHRPDREQRFLPDPSQPLEAGTLLIVAGHRTDLDRLASALSS
jgi:voltage-gated potassium channel